MGREEESSWRSESVLLCSSLVDRPSLFQHHGERASSSFLPPSERSDTNDASSPVDAANASTVGKQRRPFKFDATPSRRWQEQT